MFCLQPNEVFCIHMGHTSKITVHVLYANTDRKYCPFRFLVCLKCIGVYF